MPFQSSYGNGGIPPSRNSGGHGSTSSGKAVSLTSSGGHSATNCPACLAAQQVEVHYVQYNNIMMIIILHPPGINAQKLKTKLEKKIPAHFYSTIDKRAPDM